MSTQTHDETYSVPFFVGVCACVYGRFCLTSASSVGKEDERKEVKGGERDVKQAQTHNRTVYRHKHTLA
jgi:hypothetical protein